MSIEYNILLENEFTTQTQGKEKLKNVFTQKRRIYLHL